MWQPSREAVASLARLTPEQRRVTRRLLAYRDREGYWSPPFGTRERTLCILAEQGLLQYFRDHDGLWAKLTEEGVEVGATIAAEWWDSIPEKV